MITILNTVREVHQNMIDTLSGVRRGMEAAGEGRQQGVGEDGIETNAARVGQNGRNYYVWGGKYHNVPRGFEIPKMNLHTLIVYWFVGSEHPVVPPLKYVKPFDFPNKNRMRITICQMKKLMNGVLVAARRDDRFDPGNFGSNIKTAEDATLLYNVVKTYFYYQSANHERRLSALGWKTVHNLYQKNQFKFANE